jgi:hypothetical protein
MMFPLERHRSEETTETEHNKKEEKQKALFKFEKCHGGARD